MNSEDVMHRQDAMLVRSICPVLFSMMSVSIAIQIPMGVFGAQAPLDDLAHFVYPFALGSIICREVFYDKPMDSHQTFLLVVIAGVFVEAVWECFEFYLDFVWGLNWQIDNRDTVLDILMGLLGAISGGLYHVLLDRLAAKKCG